MGKKYLSIFIWLLLVFYSNEVFSQATYVESVTATQLATQLSSNGGFTITNPTITNPSTDPKQLGTFANGTNAGLTVDEGILLTTGSVSHSLDNYAGTASDLKMQGDPTTATIYADPDLVSIESEATRDVAIFEFDFTIAGTEPKVFALDYQFASKEYDYWVCSQYNDIFGFFISGGDLTGTSNLATVGGTNVAVNYINSGSVGGAGSALLNPCELGNSDLYVSNAGFWNAVPEYVSTHQMVYNGFTEELRAYTILRPGITYHMKLAIGDVVDRSYDSAVYIKPIQIFDLPPTSDIDFDGANDYIDTKGFLADKTESTMMSWLKTDGSFSNEGVVCGQSNFKLFVDGNNRLKAYAKTGQLTTSYVISVNDYTYAGLTGYVQITLNGTVLQFDIGGSMTSEIRPIGPSWSTTHSFEVAPSDTILIEYVQNGASASEMDNTLFQLFGENNALIHQAWIFSLTGDTSDAYSGICTECAPIVELETPNGDAPVLLNNQWYHATTKYNGSTGALSLYLNGDSVWQATGLGSNFGKRDDVIDFAIGRNSEDEDKYFHGAIDEVKIYNKDLSDNQIREQIYQEIENVGGQVSGSTIPKPIDGGSLSWNDLILYYNMNSVFDVTLLDGSPSVKNGKIHNITTVQVQSAPLPYVANASGDWTTTGTWEYGNVWDIENLPNKDWAIVQVTNNAKVTTTASHTHLGLLVDSGSELEIQNDQLLNNTSYLKLDGQIDLVGESQLIQTTNSDLDVTSAGYLERDQQGQTSIYNYNFWSSPVNPVNAIANNTDYSIAGILKDGTTAATPQTITFDTGGYDGASGAPITLADYWIFKYVNKIDLYANWMTGHIRSTGTLKVGEGYTQKGTGSAASTQNYVFSGKPNNGIIQHTIGANNVYLVGNPYASALDANQFINDNLASVESAGDVIGTGSSTGALYFWEHFSTNSSHVFAAYEGGYATYNLAGGVIAIPDPDVSSSGAGTIRPGRYVPVAQGFFVQGSPAGGTIEFNNGQRAYKREAIVGDDSVFTKTASAESASSTSTNTADLQRVFFKFTTPDGPQRELLLAVKEGLVDGMNYGYDARMLDDQVTDCAWVLKGETDIADEKLVIQGIGAIYEDLELPLQIKVGTEGICKFEVGDVSDLDPSLEVYFLDAALNLATKLEAGIPVEFNLASGEYNNRFYVVFKVAEVLAIDDIETISDDLVVFYNTTTGSISISDSSVFTAKNVSLYNVLGQEVLKSSTSYTNVSEIAIPVQVATGTYLVTFDYNNGTQITKKLLIK